MVRRLVGYAVQPRCSVQLRHDLSRLNAVEAAVNYFSPRSSSRKRGAKGQKFIKRYSAPATPYERALTHPKLSAAISSVATCPKMTLI